MAVSDSASPSRSAVRRRFRTLTGRLALGVSLLTAQVPARGQDTPPISLEHQVKIAFLYNFARFVEWPKATFARPDAPVILGILGSDEFCSDIEKMLQGKTVDSRPLVIRHVRSVEQVQPSQILFIGTSVHGDLARILGLLSGVPILTVGDTDRFTSLGGMISFRMEANKVRFEINIDAAERAGLKLSSKLLSVSRVVHDERRAKD